MKRDRKIKQTCTAFHCGAGKFPYTDLEGQEKGLYHYGYLNYSGFMKEAI